MKNVFFKRLKEGVKTFENVALFGLLLIPIILVYGSAVCGILGSIQLMAGYTRLAEWKLVLGLFINAFLYIGGVVNLALVVVDRLPTPKAPFNWGHSGWRKRIVQSIATIMVAILLLVMAGVVASFAVTNVEANAFLSGVLFFIFHVGGILISLTATVVQ